MVIALVTIKKNFEYKLSDEGVRDSKLISKKKREFLFPIITEICDKIKVVKIYPREINKAFEDKVSLNYLEVIHFSNLFDKFKNEINTLYLDSPDVIQERFGVYFQKLSKKPVYVKNIKFKKVKEVKYTKIISEHKADLKYPIVSAASIIAKVIRDNEMEKIEKKLNIKLGSGYPSDRITIEGVKENIKNKQLNQYIRKHWKTMERIKQTKLVF